PGLDPGTVGQREHTRNARKRGVRNHRRQRHAHNLFAARDDQILAIALDLDRELCGARAVAEPPLKPERLRRHSETSTSKSSLTSEPVALARSAGDAANVSSGWCAIRTRRCAR